MNKLAQSNCPRLCNSSLRSLKLNNRIKRNLREGLTLIELLVAVALTLVIIFAMIRAFKASSDQISLGRAKMDMHNKMRVVGEQLRTDMRNATRTPNPLSTNDGYFEYVEGELTDSGEPGHSHAVPALSFLGDIDDTFSLTVRSEGSPYIGRWVNPTTGITEQIESYVAEVVWWVVHDDTFNVDGEVEYDESIRLYRRVLLIRPDLAVNPLDAMGDPIALTSDADYESFFQANDVSVRLNTNNFLEANSIVDLAARENRFGRKFVSAFPFEMDTSGMILAGGAAGQDLMLDDCTAFDIKIYDPAAEVFRPDAALVAAEPSLGIGQMIDFDDAGFADLATLFPPAANPGSYPQVGSYVNLGYDPGTTATSLTGNTGRWFANDPFENGYTFANRTYCTWWDGYERNGVDEDDGGAGLVDEGADGIDNDNANGVDDNGELETRPPYAYPIRSMEVTIRMIEKKTNQVLQKSIRESFVPN